jgi:hypothetical protein
VGRSFTGLLRSLVPVLAVLLLLVWWQRGAPRPVPTDPAPDIAYARRVSPVPLPAPAGLPAGWRATSSRVDLPGGEGRSPVTLAIGYLAPTDRFAQVVVTDQTAATVLRERAAGATRDGTTPVGGAAWDRYRSGRGEAVLVSRVGATTVLVTGDAADAELAQLAGSVRGP